GRIRLGADALGREEREHRPPHRGIVVDDEDGRLDCRHLTLLTRALSRTSGSVKHINVLSAIRSAHMPPPWSVTVALQMARPMRRRDGLAVKKGWTSRPAVPPATPGRLSPTMMPPSPAVPRDVPS